MPMASSILRTKCSGEVDLANQLMKLTLCFTDSSLNITTQEVFRLQLMIDSSLLGYDSMVIGK